MKTQNTFNLEGLISCTSDVVCADNTKPEAHKDKIITLSITGKSYIESNHNCAATTIG